jgi:hypothetical protein
VIVGSKDLDCGLAELSVNLGWTRGHDSLFPDLSYFHDFLICDEAGTPSVEVRLGHAPASATLYL